MPDGPAAAADHPELFAHFGAEEVSGRSIYPYAPVFRCRIDGTQAILKRTRIRPENVAAVVAVTRQWADHGIPVVTALDLPVENPVRLGETTWVAYPYIEGRPYHGTIPEVAAAGELLGRTHADTGPARLPAYEWPDHDAESVAEDVALLRTVAGAHAPEPDVARMIRLVTGFMSDLLPPVREAALPHANGTCDYKANNLVYATGGPVMVDPDNGDHVPRLLDLAQALLLFHTEHDPAPPRLFSGEEWTAFIRAYQRHVTLTERERALWPTAVAYTLCEEGAWALTNDEADWGSARQRDFLLALMRIRSEDYPLP